MGTFSSRSHVEGLAHHHACQVLRGGDHHHAVERQVLHHGRAASEVPGGRSTRRVSSLPHSTSAQNCLMARGDHGAAPDDRRIFLRQQQVGRDDADAGAGDGRQHALLGARRPPAGSLNRLGMLGPVISASRMPTDSPARLSATASSCRDRGFPTPPLPLITAITCLILLNCVDFGQAGSGR